MNGRRIWAWGKRQAQRFRAQGHVDRFDADRVAGWAVNTRQPSEPATVTVLVDGTPALTIVADKRRDDVAAAGLGPRRCGFDVRLPARLRDGRAHRVELRLGVGGPRLRRGLLEIPSHAEKAAAVGSGAGERSGEAWQDGVDDLTFAATEGCAYFDVRLRAVVGWANGPNTVDLVWSDGHAQAIPVDKNIPGFGPKNKIGFRATVPEDLQDGRVHEVHARCGRTGEALTGSPVRVSLWAGLPRVDVVSFDAGHLVLCPRSADGSLSRHPVRLTADGHPVALDAIEEGLKACLSPQARHLIVSDEEGRDLARFEVLGDQLGNSGSPLLPRDALLPETCAAARTAFAAFCAAPDDRFDPLWYRWSNADARVLDSPAALLAHYARDGAAAGFGPGPGFDESTARAQFPAIEAAIRAGDLPCAFALELVLGRNALGPGVAARGHDALNPGPPLDVPVPARSPPFTGTARPSQNIYAAWLSRLVANDEDLDAIFGDELAARRDIAEVTLTRAPLVSIIMPSWNRAFTIGEAIQSVLDQSYTNWELIICDDASEDRTQDVVLAFDDARIRYLQFIKSNAAGARNKGLSHARGEYIAFLDSDNLWHPLFLDIMLRRLMANPGSAIAYSAFLDIEIVGAQARLLSVSRRSFRPIQLSSRNFMDLNTIVFHRRVYDWMGGFDAELERVEDWDLVLRYTSVFRPDFVDRIGVYYRRNVAWAQVTKRVQDLDAKYIVNDKKRRRLEEQHERLAVRWTGRRPRITVFCPTAARAPAFRTDIILAAELAAQVRTFADVDLVHFGAPDIAERVLPARSGIKLHSLPRTLRTDPHMLGAALGPILRGRSVLTVGSGQEVLRRVSGLDLRMVYGLLGATEGSLLQGLAEPAVRFYLGAVPLRLPEPAPEETDPVWLVLASRSALQDDHSLRALGLAARGRDASFLILPGAGSGWCLLDKAGFSEPELDPETGLPLALARVRVTVAMRPMDGLDPFELALVNAFQSRGVPLAIQHDAIGTDDLGLARQWVDAGAAHEIEATEPEVLATEVRSLLEDDTILGLLSARSRVVHSIAHHPDLVRERLIHAIHRILHSCPLREVIDD